MKIYMEKVRVNKIKNSNNLRKNRWNKKINHNRNLFMTKIKI
jgi:hypothetical protein